MKEKKYTVERSREAQRIKLSHYHGKLKTEKLNKRRVNGSCINKGSRHLRAEAISTSPDFLGGGHRTRKQNAMHWSK